MKVVPCSFHYNWDKSEVAEDYKRVLLGVGFGELREEQRGLKCIL